MTFIKYHKRWDRRKYESKFSASVEHFAPHYNWTAKYYFQQVFFLLSHLELPSYRESTWHLTATNVSGNDEQELCLPQPFPHLKLSFLFILGQTHITFRQCSEEEEEDKRRRSPQRTERQNTRQFIILAEEVASVVDWPPLGKARTAGPTLHYGNEV
ncbi:uncharacterized protein LOC110837260 isoform X2 [Zootermopsis nevadensis]|uniref:uncharacterized protein LOC110837260 isoform X2 n=1 Tax=Zootermopsis nevadensis TaxID=136037 RepID=UPI000B8ED225|nr:uncharacterized protein LOC110837260 isoform X2 [Zootermopsis nevadensis]